MLDYFKSNAEDVTVFLILEALKNNENYGKEIQDSIDLSKEISEKYNDERYQKFCFYLKYETADGKEILMLRYGFSFDTIEWLKDYIESISEEEILFKDISMLEEYQLKEIDRYLP